MSEPRARGWQWTQADDDQLRAMLEAGMKATEIAPKLKRTVGAVYCASESAPKDQGAVRSRLTMQVASAPSS